MRNALAAKCSIAVLTATLVAFSGCAAVQRQESDDAAAMLKSAGFTANATADAEKRFDVAGLPAQQIVARNAAGDTVYLYSDPYECQCVYDRPAAQAVGTAARGTVGAPHGAAATGFGNRFAVWC